VKLFSFGNLPARRIFLWIFGFSGLPAALAIECSGENRRLSIIHINVRMCYYRLPPPAIRSLIQPTDAYWGWHFCNIAELFRVHSHQFAILCDLQYAWAQCVGLAPWLRRNFSQIMQPVAFCYHQMHTSFIRYSLSSRSTIFIRYLFGADNIEDLGTNNHDGFYSPFFINRRGSALSWGFITATFSMLAWRLWGWLTQWAFACAVGSLQYNIRICRKKRRRGMEQLQFNLPGEEETVLDANVHEQLLSVMANIILAIIAIERNTDDDHKSA
jgi:hypothetical protein